MTPYSPSPDSYKDDRLYRVPTIEETQALAELFAQRDTEENPHDYERPLSQAEQQIIEGVLRFVDCHLPSPSKSREISLGAKISRVMANNALLMLPSAELELEDLRQEMRLSIVTTLRNFDPERGTIFGLLSVEFRHRINKVGSQALKSGFIFIGSQSTKTNDQRTLPASTLRDQVITTPFEDGYSDTYQALVNHPGHVAQVPLHFKQPKEELDDEALPYDQRPLEPVIDATDTESADWIDLIELPRTDTLERLFRLVERGTEQLTEREKSVLRYMYEDGLTLTEIAELPTFNLSRARVGQIHQRALSKLSIKPVREQLQHLRR